MWKTVAKEEKRVKDLVENAKRRAQRRRAYYDSRLGDPMQLLRVSGTAVRLGMMKVSSLGAQSFERLHHMFQLINSSHFDHSSLETNPEAYSVNEDPKNLMPWASDSSVKIDRFDGRALLDFLPATTSTMIDSGLRVDRDEDGIGNELRFQRWQDLVDKARLQISEEQCLVENEEEWNDLVARHQALIGKVSEKKQDTNELTAGHRFAFNYGTGIVEEKDISRPVDQEVTALEDENILERLDDLTFHERDNLDALGAEFHIQDYYRLLQLAKQEHDARVLQLKVNAVNLERTLAGKKPLKSSEIDVMMSSTMQNKAGGRRKQTRRYGRPERSSSPVYRSTRRSSPSYEPYKESTSRSGSESPNVENLEYIMEFQGDLESEPIESWDSQESLHLSSGMESTITTSNWHSPSSGPTRRPHSLGADRKANTTLASSSSASIPSPVKMSLAEKLKQRMRQGLDMSTALVGGVAAGVVVEVVAEITAEVAEIAEIAVGIVAGAVAGVVAGAAIRITAGATTRVAARAAARVVKAAAAGVAAEIMIVIMVAVSIEE
ncbi:hypothetical protein BGX26_004528 [Mortierella sp. AD094]|nr:hypothetical protein BGX26_004528 [Mortierella sp. AD094]